MNSNRLMDSYAFILLCYAGWRTYDYISGSLTGVDVTTSTIVAVFFLFASEIGLLLWLHRAMPNSTTELQETVSVTMIFADFLGSMILGLADILKHNVVYQVDMHWIDPVLLLTPWVLLAVNVFGIVVYHLNDADNILAKKNRAAEFAIIKTKMAIHDEAIKKLNASKTAIAETIKADIAEAMRREAVGDIARQFGLDPASYSAPAEPSKPTSEPVTEPGRLSSSMRQKISDGVRKSWEARRGVPQLDHGSNGSKDMEGTADNPN